MRFVTVLELILLPVKLLLGGAAPSIGYIIGFALAAIGIVTFCNVEAWYHIVLGVVFCILSSGFLYLTIRHDFKEINKGDKY